MYSQKAKNLQSKYTSKKEKNFGEFVFPLFWMKLGKLRVNNEGKGIRKKEIDSSPLHAISDYIESRACRMLEFESSPLDLVVRPLNNVVTKQTATGNIYRDRKIHRFTVKLRRPAFENAKISSLT